MGNSWLNSGFPVPNYNDAYDDWYADLCAEAATHNWEDYVEEYVRQDKQAWRPYFEAGYNAEQALRADATYWEEE